MYRVAGRAVLISEPPRPGAGDRVDARVTPLLERIDARERELAAAGEQLRTQIEELAARLREFDEEVENLAVTHRTLLT